MNHPRFAAALVVAVVLAAAGAPPAHAAFSSTEFKCSQVLAKSFAKLESAILKSKTKCHAAELSGKTDDPNDCDPLPADLQAKVDKARAKLVAKVAKSCVGSCNITTDMDCVNDLSCPARHQASPPNNNVAETCTGLKLSRLDWPGPYCPSILGHGLLEPDDLGTCVVELSEGPAEGVDRAVYGGLNESSGLGDTAVKCVNSIAKAMPKALSSAYLAVAGCRDARRSIGNDDTLPAWACAAGDPTTQAALDEAGATLGAAIDKACTDGDIAALPDLCDAVVDTPPSTKAAAKDCLGEVLREVAAGERSVGRHRAAPFSMINATHPHSASAYCGDGVVTADREEHTGVGEECDGDADDACGAGSCYPPGDTFECTCDNVVRERFRVHPGGGVIDSDAGWKGSSHDATHIESFGYVTEMSNCDCDEVTGATCTGSSTDQVCDVVGNMAPRCSNDPHGTLSCDEHGNGNGLPENWDCFRCDDFSINAGDHCANNTSANETVCQSQCIDDATGAPVVPQVACQNQGDCAEGESCRGRCDNTPTCNTITEGSPLPQVSAAVSVCIMLEYKTDIVGTKNIVTGEQAVDYTTRSIIQLGSLFTVPCPSCTGTCPAGSNMNGACFGRCDASDAPCLLDEDCTGPGDTTCVATADDCPCFGRCDVTSTPCSNNGDCGIEDTQCVETPEECALSVCSLDFRCTDGPNKAKLCRPDTSTPLGVVSHDCPPSPNGNLSGTGVQQPFGNVTTEQVEFPPGTPCTEPAWSNFDCPCPADAPPIIGTATAPNACAAACDAGANQGQGCGNPFGGVGGYTVCVGGSEAGATCDEDSDCDGGTCSGNPTECVSGPPSLLGVLCSTNGDCGGGVCDDACPGGHCVPLCLTQGACENGSRDGDPCATEQDCRECSAGNPLMAGLPCAYNAQCDSSTGAGDGACTVGLGVACVVDDPEEGVCASGPVKYRCTGDGFTTLPCAIDYGLCSIGGVCLTGSTSLLGSPCTLSSDCVVGGVPVRKGCEAGDDGVLGNSDDNPGAGDCEPRPEDCYINNGLAEGGDTLNGGGSATNVDVNAAFCTPPNSTSAINDISGFGGPSRVRRTGIAEINVTSFP